MKNIVTRSLSGVVYVALIVSTLLLGSDWFMWLGGLFCIVAMYEFQRLTGLKNKDGHLVPNVIRLLDIATALSLCVASHDPELFHLSAVLILSGYVLVRFVLALYDKSADAFASVGRSALSIIYIGVPLAIAVLVDRMSEGSVDRHIVLVMFVMIWLNDTGAYCVGSLFGRHRLCERLSPKKSWEGFWGGMIFCLAAGMIYSVMSGSSVDAQGGWHNLYIWTGFGAVVSIFATWGDLFESLMKRSFGVKDSGNIIPGHGGILDRIDSLLLVAPAAFIYALLTSMI